MSGEACGKDFGGREDGILDFFHFGNDFFFFEQNTKCSESSLRESFENAHHTLFWSWVSALREKGSAERADDLNDVGRSSAEIRDK